MRSGALLFVGALFLAGHVAAQQSYRCVDSGGKTFFTDKPGPNCKPVAQRGGTSAGGSAKGLRLPGDEGNAGRQSAKTGGSGFSPERERELLASRCRTYKEELEWLGTPAGKGVANHSARVGQVTRAMRECR